MFFQRCSVHQALSIESYWVVDGLQLAKVTLIGRVFGHILEIIWHFMFFASFVGMIEGFLMLNLIPPKSVNFLNIKIILTKVTVAYNLFLGLHQFLVSRNASNGCKQILENLI